MGGADDALYRTSSRTVREELEAVIEDALRQIPRDAAAEVPPLIACVDDDRLFLESLARVIRRQGYRVAGYTEPQLALDELEKIRPDLLIVDVLMPAMSGFEFLDAVRRRPDSPPVVLLSAVGSPENLAAGKEKGAACYLTKPCPTETLQEVLRGLIRKGGPGVKGPYPRRPSRRD
jgi:DNA-binding response OmpR family regulator